MLQFQLDMSMSLGFSPMDLWLLLVGIIITSVKYKNGKILWQYLQENA